MGRVVLDMSMSLDGFVAGPNDEIEPLHDWLEDGTAVHGKALLDAATAFEGACVMGRRTFGFVDNPGAGWTAPDGTVFETSVFVLTHEARPPEVQGPTSYVFVNDGVEAAVEQAQLAAGEGNVSVMGANAAQQVIAAGQLDELVLHLVPVLLGRGISLFGDAPQLRLERTLLLEDPGVTHVAYRVLR
jgi:dihydrofolate reductase